MHASILLPSVHEPYCDLFLRPSEKDSSGKEANSKNAWIDAVQTQVRRHLDDTPHWENSPAAKNISNENFNISDYETHVLPLLSHNKEYRSVHCCLKHNLGRPAINPLYMNPKMAKVSNIYSTWTLITWRNQMSYLIPINSWTSSTVLNIHLVNRGNIRDTVHIFCFSHIPVKWIEFLKQQPALIEHGSHAPVKELTDVERDINSEVKSSDGQYNKQVH